MTSKRRRHNMPRPTRSSRATIPRCTWQLTLWGPAALSVTVLNLYATMTSESLLAIPLYVMMASVLQRSGVIESLYRAMELWSRRLPGGLAIGTIIICTVIAAMTGIVGAAVAAMGMLALPSMLKRKYSPELAIGTICASGSLGTMIPPSIVLIIYGLITETSIKSLFTAAFLPGFMLASFIIIYIIIRTQLDPDQAPLREPKEGDPVGLEKFKIVVAFLSIL